MSETTQYPSWAPVREYLLGGPCTQVRVFRGDRVGVSAGNPAGISPGIYGTRDLQYFAGTSWAQVLQGYTSGTYVVQAGSPERRGGPRPQYEDWYTSALDAERDAEHLSHLLSAGWRVVQPQDQPNPVSVLGSLLRALREGRVRPSHTLVDSLRGHGGISLQRDAEGRVLRGVWAASRYWSAGQDGTLTITRDQDGRITTDAHKLRKARDESDRIPVSWGELPSDAIPDVYADVLSELLRIDTPDKSRLVEVRAEVSDADAFRDAIDNRKLIGVGITSKGAQDWLRTCARTNQQTFGRTKVSVLGKTRARNVGEVILALKHGLAFCASEAEEDRITSFLRACTSCPGITVVCNEVGATTWAGLVKLLSLRRFRALRQRFARESSIDAFTSGEAYADADRWTEDGITTGNLLILSEGGDPTAESVLQASEEEDLLLLCKASVRKRADLSGWTDKRTEGVLSVLPYLMAGLPQGIIAGRLGITTRTVRNRIRDLQDSLRPVLCEEDGTIRTAEDWSEVLRVLCA